jgi:hypothetical protein
MEPRVFFCDFLIYLQKALDPNVPILYRTVDIIASIILGIWISFFMIYNTLTNALTSCIVPFVPDSFYEMMIYQPGYFIVIAVEVGIIGVLISEIVRLIIKT